MTLALSSIRDRAEALWRELLDLPIIAPDADFFDLGGDSMRAIEMLVTILGEADTSIDLEVYFDRPTLGHLISMIEEAIGGAG